MNRVDRKKVMVIGGHRKVKCEINQALVMINLYVNFNHSFAKQFIVRKVADRQANGQTNEPGDDNTCGYPPKFWLRLKNERKNLPTKSNSSKK